jgi:phosphatidylglycerophosphate synthase
VAALAGVALALDGVDGAVARRTGTASALGARFDMEIDAALILALSVLLVRPVGAWVLGIGVMRYLFLAAGLAFPWVTAPLPPRVSRKVVAAAQGVILLVGVAGVLPPAVRLASLLAALTALTWSFGRDVRWLVLSRTTRTVAPALSAW